MKRLTEGTICATKRRLAVDAAESARLYYEAVSQLTERDDNIAQLLATVKEAHHRANTARISFEEHLDSHGC